MSPVFVVTVGDVIGASVLALLLLVWAVVTILDRYEAWKRARHKRTSHCSLLDCLLVSGRLLPPADAKYAIEAGHSETWLTALGTSGILMVEKSRQVMATWICCAYLLWRAKFRDHQLILVQSKKEEDAANLVFNGEAWVARIYRLADIASTVIARLRVGRGRLVDR